MYEISLSRRLWLGCTVGLAILCGVLRRWQMATVFEPELGLAGSMAPASVALAAMMVISAAVLIILASRQQIIRPPRGAGRGRRTGRFLVAEGDRVTLVATVAAAFLALVAAPILFSKGLSLWKAYRVLAKTPGTDPRGVNNGVLMLLAAVTSVLAFFGLLSMAQSRYRGPRKGRGAAALLLPALNGCFWLMECYRRHASDPVLWDYAPLLLAVICGMLFYMDCTGLCVGMAKPRRTLWMAGATVILSAVALGGGWSLGSTVILLLSQTVMALSVLWQLPYALEHLPPLPREEPAPEATVPDPEAEEPAQSQEIEEEETHE